MEKGTIMVVDDKPDNLILLEKMLSKEGYIVRPFRKGLMALESAWLDPPDLFLLDIMMPEIDGYEMCARLKANERTNPIPVLFLSAKTVALDKVRGFEEGAVDYITKPFHIGDVLARIKTHLTLYRYQREIENKNDELSRTLDELKKTQSQLIQSEKMASLGVMAAGVAHEINNPVNFISISCKGLQKKIKPIIDLLKEWENTYDSVSGTQKLVSQLSELDVPYLTQAISELTANIDTGAERATEIVDGLRSYSRPDSKAKQSVDIHRCITSALIILQNQTKDRIEIVKQYSEITDVMGYPGKLTQVFMNIIKNAIDAVDSLSEKRIAIRTEPTCVENVNYIRVSIEDNGSGISSKILNQIFDPFFTTKEVGQGTGLGLSIVIGIVDNHGGKIEVEKVEGGGTRFIVLIPSIDK